MHLSRRVQGFTESVIRGMTRECLKYGGVNLAQGFPDFDAPEELKAAAQRAIQEGHNQYAITWGSPSIRRAISRKVSLYSGFEVDPEEEVTVVCGATEGMMATLMALLNPGEEVIIFEPFYENYGPDAILSGSTPRYVPLRPPAFTFDPEELRAAFTPTTRAIIVNTPHNPTGHVFTPEELGAIRDLCLEFDVTAVTDEVYEHILFDGHRHLRLIASQAGGWAMSWRPGPSPRGSERPMTSSPSGPRPPFRRPPPSPSPSPRATMKGLGPCMSESGTSSRPT
jgi:aminotransferase